MRNGTVTRQFQNVEMPRNVRMDIGCGIFERIAHPGLGTQMDDPVNRLVGKRMGQRIGVGKIDIDKLICIGMLRLKACDARALQVERIIGREIVDSNYPLAAFQQSVSDVHSDKASRTGDERRQISSP